MVVPLREIGNKLFLFSVNMDTTTAMNLPTMNTSAYIGMDLFNVVRNSPNNYNEVRGCTLTHGKPSSREISMSSIILLVTYHDRMMMNNDNDSDTIMEPINMPQLSYVTLGG